MMLSAMEQQNQATIASDISIVSANAQNPSTSSMTNTLQVTPLTKTEHSSFSTYAFASYLLYEFAYHSVTLYKVLQGYCKH